jgi:hypothetical protein
VGAAALAFTVLPKLPKVDEDEPAEVVTPAG